MSSNPRTYARSFTGGEVTPDFFGRVDDVKYQTGLSTCRNFTIKPHGPAQNRAGTAMVREVKDSAKKTRVIPFVYSDDQSYAVELGAGYFRFHTLGATLLCPAASAWVTATAYAIGDLIADGGVTYYCTAAHTSGATRGDDADKWYAEPASGEYELPNPYADGDLASIRLIQSNDIITLTHSAYPAAELQRHGATNWTYVLPSFLPTLSAPGSVHASATPATTSPGTPTLQSYVVTAVKGKDESKSSAELDDTNTGQPSGGVPISGISQANPGLISSFNAPTTTFNVGEKVYISGVTGMTELNNNFYFVDTYTETSTPIPYSGGVIVSFNMTLKDAGGAPIDTSGFGAYSGGGTIAPAGGTAGVASCSNNLFDDGAYNTISWSTVSGAERYYVYKKANGLFGYIGQTQELSFTDDNIAADISKTPPIVDPAFNTADNYPSACGYFEQRRIFGGTTTNPARVRGTRSGTETNLSYSLPSQDADAIDFTIASRTRQAIRHIVSLANLILLSESSEWRVAPAAGAVLTPDVSVREQSAIGSAEAAPVLVNNNVLFAAARGGHVRELAYNWQVNGYITGDISLRAPHLFDGLSIVDMAYAKAPIPIAWAVSSNGNLLGLTYVPEQEVGGWHRHDTVGGVFEHIAVVPEGDEDVLYAIVKRGAKRYVERMASRANGALEDAFFVDCGVTQSFDPAVSTVSGLTWLEGQTVSILADGAVHTSQVVTGGAVTLDAPASKVTIGLPITADLETLPLAAEAQAFAQGRPKNVCAVWLKVFKSSGIKVGPTFDKLTEYKQRTVEDYGSPPALVTDEIEVRVSPRWSTGGTVCVRQDQPLPLEVAAMTIEFSVGG